MILADFIQKFGGQWVQQVRSQQVRSHVPAARQARPAVEVYVCLYIPCVCVCVFVCVCVCVRPCRSSS
jgi:hypothetical protein